MSFDAQPGGAIVTAVARNDAVVRHALRIACGVAFAAALAQGLGWGASFLAPVLLLYLLAVQWRAPTLASGLGFLIALGAPLGLVLLLGPALLPHPDLYLGAIALAAFVGFYFQAGSASLNIFVALIAVTAVPVLMVSSPSAARELSGLLLEAGIAAMLIAWLVHAAIPEPRPNLGSISDPVADRPPPAARARAAVLDALVVVPLLALLMINTVTSATVMIVSTLSIVRQGNIAQGTRAAFGLMLGNLIGGAAALGAFGLLTVAPTFPFLVALLALAGLLFGWRIATAGPTAPLLVVACTTILILLGAGLPPFKETGTAFVTRVLYVLLAGAYAIGMLALVELLRPRPRRAENLP
jgi:hypothetical protein